MLRLAPELGDAWVRRALDRTQSEDYKGAMEDCNTAVRIDSSRAEGYYGRGMVHDRQSQFPEVLEDLNEAVIRNRNYRFGHSSRRH